MTVDPNTQNSKPPVDVQPDTDEAVALAFLYSNPEYGFKPEEVCQHTSILKSNTSDALSSLFEKDAVGKTVDGYYHALDDQPIAQYADTLQKGETFSLDTGKEPYPENHD